MMKFKLKNIGLIEDTELSLNDLTFICGQNNTGKTYITYSIYGFLSSWEELVDFDLKRGIFEELNDNGFISLNIKDFNSKVNKVLANLSNDYTNILHNIFSVEEDWFKDSKFEVFIDDVELDLSIGINTTLSSSKKEVLQIKKEVDSDIIDISILAENSKKHIPTFVLEQGINRALGKVYFGKYLRNPFIITSERTGISLFYKELDIKKNIMVEYISKSKDINPFQMLQDETSRYALPIRDNIDFTRDLTDRICKKKSFLFNDKILLKYFSDILHGNYKIANKEVYFVTKKKGNKSSKQIPMYFASSATKSLAELYFYVRHTAQKNDLLIIDEPELNLHPDNHRIITRLLAYLSNKGINIFITTHSDYIIKEFNNLIRLNHKINDKSKIMKKYNYKEEDILDFEKVSAYINNYGELDFVDVTNLGLSVETFDNTINELSSSMDDIYFNIED